MSKQTSPDNWNKLIEDFQASGQSISAWCHGNNLKVHQLAYRLQKAKEANTQKTASWLPVDLNGDTALTVKVGPYAIIVDDDFDPVLLKKNSNYPWQPMIDSPGACELDPVRWNFQA